ncbi:hypothetical protein IHE45_20G024900 [Dioscorea alata]|uniref:Uncharacterized protein n=1 Tax=Dioscorea alata TaxID=55571 RepID=A0ACB7TT76_DIOAL|nr:hypothetical protein IHE45_20G024900 [Dioscorea alata]
MEVDEQTQTHGVADNSGDSLTTRLNPSNPSNDSTLDDANSFGPRLKLRSRRNAGRGRGRGGNRSTGAARRGENGGAGLSTCPSTCDEEEHVVAPSSVFVARGGRILRGSTSSRFSHHRPSFSALEDSTVIDGTPIPVDTEAFLISKNFFDVAPDTPSKTDGALTLGTSPPINASSDCRASSGCTVPPANSFIVNRDCQTPFPSPKMTPPVLSTSPPSPPPSTLSVPIPSPPPPSLSSTEIEKSLLSASDRASTSYFLPPQPLLLTSILNPSSDQFHSALVENVKQAISPPDPPATPLEDAETPGTTFSAFDARGELLPQPQPDANPEALPKKAPSKSASRLKKGRQSPY